MEDPSFSVHNKMIKNIKNFEKNFSIFPQFSLNKKKWRFPKERGWLLISYIISCRSCRCLRSFSHRKGPGHNRKDGIPLPKKNLILVRNTPTASKIYYTEMLFDYKKLNIIIYTCHNNYVNLIIKIIYTCQ